MGWIGITDLFSQRFSRSKKPSPKVLMRGTLLLEFEYTSTQSSTTSLLSHAVDKVWPRDLSICMTRDNQILLRQSHRAVGAECRLALRLPPSLGPGRLRVQYSWDAVAGQARLSVQGDTLEQVHIVQGSDPLPVAMVDIETMFSKESTCFAPFIRVAAVSDAVEPVALPPGLAAGSQIRTETGYTCIQDLKIGDRVITRTGELLPVRHVLRQELPCYGLTRAIHLRAPYFGLRKDLVCAPDYKILVEGVDMEYALGRDRMLVEARYLSASPGARASRTLGTQVWHHIVLDKHVAIEVQGLWAESLYLGDLRDHAMHLGNSVLSCLPQGAIPSHKKMCDPKAVSCEARWIASQKVA